jgi:hypothetical protein
MGARRIAGDIGESPHVIVYAVVDDALSHNFPLGVVCIASVSMSAPGLRA